MDDEDDFLAAVEADNKSIAEEPKPEPVKVEVEVTEAPEPTPQPEPVEQAAEPEVLELTEPVPGTPKPEPGFVPIAAMLDARDKQKAAEARLAQIEQQRIQQQPVQAPDPYEDPEGFAEFQQAQVGSALYQMNLRYSEKLAKVEHGAEIVEAAKQWGVAKCDTDPHFNAKVATSEDPIGLVVSEYRRDEIASKVNMPEFEQFQAWKAAQGQIEHGGQPPPSTAPSSIPPRSLASAPSAGDMLTEPVQADDEIFDEVIPKR